MVTTATTPHLIYRALLVLATIRVPRRVRFSPLILAGDCNRSTHATPEMARWAMEHVYAAPLEQNVTVRAC
jgi:hypothetical protein